METLETYGKHGIFLLTRAKGKCQPWAMRITKHRQKILDALREWFRTHKEGPTLEELCTELGMHPRQKATVQRWLQTLRGIDVEWVEHSARSLHLLKPEADEPDLRLSVTETLRYLATGVVQWEELPTEKRSHIPDALRIGMSRMYLTSLLRGEEAPSDLKEFFEWASSPVTTWGATEEIKNLSTYVTLIEDGLASDFARQWQVVGNVKKEVEESVLRDVLMYCRGRNLEDAYRAFRHLIITKPTLRYSEYRSRLASPVLLPLRELLLELEIYKDMVKIGGRTEIHLCPRCKYIQRLHSGTYKCYSQWCEKLTVAKKVAPLPTIPTDEVDQWKAVSHGVHEFGTLPGIWEIELATSLMNLGARVTMWPVVDEYDLLVELPKKIRWAIDVKDWSVLDEERLQKVQCQSDATDTFVVFPNQREEFLYIKRVREQKEPELGGVRLRLLGEVIAQAKAILNK